MIQFGKTLREAREAKGLSIKELAARIHVLGTTLEELENEDFSRIPAPIYGRGFVKLYCEEVGLDPKPMIAEFMDILNGNHPLEIKERVTQPAMPAPEEKPVEAPMPPAEPEPIREPETVLDEIPPSDPIIPPPAPAIPAVEPIAPPIEATIPPTSGSGTPYQDDFFNPRPGVNQVPLELHPPAANSIPAANSASEIPNLPPKQTISRYAAPLKEMKVPSLPPSFWRLTLLAVVAIAIICLAGYAIGLLHRAVTDQPAQPQSPAVTEAAAEKPNAAPEKSAAPTTLANPNPAREIQKIPSLYVD